MKNDNSTLDRTLLRGREYRGASRIDGALVYMKNTHPVGYNELVEITAPDGRHLSGQVLDTSDDAVCVQVFEGTDGLNLPDTRMHFLGEPLSHKAHELLHTDHNRWEMPRSPERNRNGYVINPNVKLQG